MAVIKASDADFAAALSSKPLSIVKYYADWCGSCKLIAPKFRRLSEDERFTGVQFLEVNAEENPDARHRAGVNNLPFFATGLTSNRALTPQPPPNRTLRQKLLNPPR